MQPALCALDTNLLIWREIGRGGPAATPAATCVYRAMFVTMPLHLHDAQQRETRQENEATRCESRL